MRSTTINQRRATRRKIFAIAAVGAVIGIGTTATLAAWNDNEWVVGGTASGGAGVGTSKFDVWQNRGQAPTNLSTWDDHETEPTAGGLIFSLGALALTPGDSTYAPVAIQTKPDSIAGSLTVQKPVVSSVPVSDPASLLWGALQYSVKVSATSPVTGCTAATWAGFGTAVATDQDFDAVFVAPSSQTVSANQGNIQYYCFKVTLPAAPSGVSDVNDLQGLTSAPAWRFAATSTP